MFLATNESFWKREKRADVDKTLINFASNKDIFTNRFFVYFNQLLVSNVQSNIRPLNEGNVSCFYSNQTKFHLEISPHEIPFVHLMFGLPSFFLFVSLLIPQYNDNNSLLNEFVFTECVVVFTAAFYVACFSCFSAVSIWWTKERETNNDRAQLLVPPDSSVRRMGGFEKWWLP